MNHFLFFFSILKTLQHISIAFFAAGFGEEMLKDDAALFRPSEYRSLYDDMKTIY